MRLSLKLRDAHRVGVTQKKHRRHAVTKAKILCKRRKEPWRNRRQQIRLLVPFALAIGSDQNRKSVMRFLAKLRENALERNMRVILDFSETEVTLITGVLLFVSELDRIKRIAGDEFSVSIENVKSRRVNQLLHQIGVYALCGISSKNLSEDAFEDSVKNWRYATGERANEQTNKAFESFEGRLSPELAKGMWKSVSEAVVNSVQHAYLAPRGVNGPRMGSSRWWMFSQERDGRLTVAVCDLGIGIPRSLPLNWKPGFLGRVLDSVTGQGPDTRSIQAALKLGASSTGETHRGKGLPQIWQTLQTAEKASISIISNRGQLTWNGDERKEFPMEFVESIAGTIILWTVNVAESYHEG